MANGGNFYRADGVFERAVAGEELFADDAPLTAAKSLYPGSCTEFNTVKAAWDAISVPAQSADPTC